MYNAFSDAQFWEGKSVLVTGGTGSFGRKFTEIMLRNCNLARLIVFSRDELKQHEMRQVFPEDTFDKRSPMRYFIGDIRDQSRLQRAMKGVDIVVHAAALKQVPTCEYNPIEAILTNVMGTRNVVEAALDAGVQRAMLVSTDKAVCPVNLYGATKLVAEKLFVHANVYSAGKQPFFSCVRYGNVLGSRGSVIPLFYERRGQGKVPITDGRMTRFWVTLDQVVYFVASCIQQMHGGEVFVPKIPSMKLTDLATAIAPECEHEHVGIRPGEKLNEVLLSEDEARHAVEMEHMFVVRPESTWQQDGHWNHGASLPEGFRYASDTNGEWLQVEELRHMAEQMVHN
jgi:UDP-N-acetylglucosamine 4,6-dehydratase